MSQPAKTLEPATAELLKRPQSLGARLVQKRQEMKLSTKLQKEFYRRLTVSTNKNTNFTLDELLVLSEGLLDVKEIDGIDLICKYEFEKRQEMIDKHSRPKPTRPDSAQRLKEVKERIEQKAKQDVIKHLERKSRNKYVVVPKHLEILQELDPINVQCRGESVPIINTSLKVHEMSFDTYKKNRNYLLNSVALSSNPTLAKKWIDRKFPSLAEMQSRPLDYIDPKIFDEKYNFLKEMLQDSGTNNYSALEGVKAKEILKLLTEGKRENLRSAGAETVEGKEKQNLDSASETVDWGELVKKIRRDQKNSKKEEQLLFVEEIKNEQKQIEDPNFKVILGPRTYSGKSGTKPPQNPSKMIKEAVNRLRKSIIYKQQEASLLRKSVPSQQNSSGETLQDPKAPLDVIQEDNRSKSLSKSNTSFSSSSDSSSDVNEKTKAPLNHEEPQRLVRDSHLGILQRLSLVPAGELEGLKAANSEAVNINTDRQSHSETPAGTRSLTARESSSNPDENALTQLDNPGLNRESSTNSESSKKSFFSVVKFATTVKTFNKAFRLRRQTELEFQRAKEESDQRWLNRDEKAEEIKHENVKAKAETALRKARASVFQAFAKKMVISADKSPSVSRNSKEYILEHVGVESDVLRRRDTVQPANEIFSLSEKQENIEPLNLHNHSVDISLGRETSKQQSRKDSSLSPKIASEDQKSSKNDAIAIKSNIKTEAWKLKVEAKQEEHKVRKEQLRVREKFRKNRLLNISKSSRQHSAGSKIQAPSRPTETNRNAAEEGHHYHREHSRLREKAPLGNFFNVCHSVKEDVKDTKSLVEKQAWETKFTYESQGKVLQRLSNLDHVDGKALEYMYLYMRNEEAQQIQNVEEVITEYHKPQRVSEKLFKAKSKATNTIYQ